MEWPAPVFIFFIILFTLMAVCGGTALAEGYAANLYYALGDHTPVQLSGAKAAAGQRFSAAEPFTAIEVNCPSWGNNKGDLTLILYKWAGSYESSIQGQSIAERTFKDFIDNAWLHMDFPEQPKGDYLWVLSNPVETVGVWKHPASTINGAFQNGRSAKGDYASRIFYTKSVPAALAAVSFGNPAIPNPYPQKSNLNLIDSFSDTWAATDALGRKLPDNSTAGNPRPGKYVGVFYWTWNYNWADTVEPKNVTEIARDFPEALGDVDHPAWGPLGSPHWWGEPLFGYYRSTDPWVLRKHGEMLSDAGVDAVFFDCTNGSFTWKESYMALCQSWSQARKDGVKTPQIVFMLAFSPTDDSVKALEELYDDLYKPGLYQDLWFYWKGKPLVMGYPDKLAKTTGNRSKDSLHKEMLDFFTFRPGQASYFQGPARTDQWGWLELYPQNGYAPTSDSGFEQATVGVAQNYSKDRGLTAMNSPDSFGRSYTEANGHDERPEAAMYGLNFQEQWERALDIDPEFVFVTGWNEWIAGRYAEWGGQINAFPDEFDMEHSRDIEPMKGGFNDNYYYQLAANIRCFKGVRPLPEPSAPITMSMDGSFGKWSGVLPIYEAYRGNTMHRNSEGWLGTFYSNDSGRNDIVEAKVARDSDMVYFMVETAGPLTAPSDPRWMRLYPDTDRNKATGWEGYDLMVCVESSGRSAVVKRHAGAGWVWSDIARVECAVGGNKLEVGVPRALFDGTGSGPGREPGSSAPTTEALSGNNRLDFEFKWTDNIPEPADIMTFYTHGDAAPSGRFNYVYRED